MDTWMDRWKDERQNNQLIQERKKNQLSYEAWFDLQVMLLSTYHKRKNDGNP